MISKNDIVLLLTDLQSKGVEGVEEQLNLLFTKQGASLDVLKFINNYRQLDTSTFYERLRKNYNEKRSNLYINIVKEVNNPQEVLTTLSALLTQILLFSKNIENKQIFLTQVRAKEITEALNIYLTTYDINQAIKLLKVIKADLVASETIIGRRK